MIIFTIRIIINLVMMIILIMKIFIRTSSGTHGAWALRREKGGYRLEQFRLIFTHCHHPLSPSYQATAYDPDSDRLFIHGGFDLNSALSDLWTFSFKANQWTLLRLRRGGASDERSVLPFHQTLGFTVGWSEAGRDWQRSVFSRWLIAFPPRPLCSH